MYGEACTQHGSLAVLIGRRGAVARFQPPAMGFDDLLGNGEAEPGILAEILLRPVGVETIEYLVQGVGPDARAVVFDDDGNLVAGAAADDADHAVLRRERAGIVDEIVDDLAQPRVVALHQVAARVALEG